MPPRNPHFTGRAALLDRLRADLHAGGTVAAMALRGMGGIGKTTLAAEYAYRYAGTYQVVWWLRSEQPATLAADYAALAAALGLPQKAEREQEIVAGAVRDWLAAHDGWLLVFDNAETPGDTRPYLPTPLRGHIIITSRNQGFGSIARPLNVELMPDAEAVVFLTERTGADDPENAPALAEALGRLPLALAQAAAYIEETGQSIGGYLRLFQSKQKALLQNAAGVRPDDHVTVATLWDVSLQRLTPEAQAVLTICAFRAPDDIPLDLLSGGAEYLPSPLAAVVGDDMALDAAIGNLRRYSLLERRDNMLAVHRLVQAVVRDRLAESEQVTWADAALHIVDKAFPDESWDVRQWPACARLLAHATRVTAAEGSATRLPETMAGLVIGVGTYFEGRAEYALARPLLEQATRLYEQTGDERGTATSLNSLGIVVAQQGDYAAATNYLRRALAIYERSFGDHPDTANSLTNLGNVLAYMDDYVAATDYHRRALAIRERSLDDHPDTANSLTNLGLVFEETGDLTGAKNLFERALAINARMLPDNHPYLKKNHGNLARIEAKLRKAQAAQKPKPKKRT